MDIQLQMRRNVEQMHATVDDLDSWMRDISKRDRSLRGDKAGADIGKAMDEDEGTDEEEEAREIEAAKAELRRLSQEEGTEATATGGIPRGAKDSTNKSKGPLTHAQKYGAWEHYDADGVVGAMEEREKDEERLRREVVRLENKRLQAQARKQQALSAEASEALRQRGNTCFQSARYSEAVELYTNALEHTPRSAVLYANRALALLKLSAYPEAEEDCDTALLLDPTQVKARLRRAQCRQATQRYDGALEDLELVLDAEPKNVSARKQLQECRQLKMQGAPRRAVASVQLTVEHVAHDPDNDNDPFVQSVAPAGELTGSPASSSATSGAVAAAAARDGVAVSDSTPGPTLHPPDDLEAPIATASVASPPAVSTARHAVTAPSASADSFAPPASSADVERVWRSLRRQPDEFGRYVLRISPESAGRLFKHNLPTEILSALLMAIDQCFFPTAAARALEFMRALTSVSRFSILTMCLEKSDVVHIGSIFAKLDAAQHGGLLPSAEDLPKLRSLYSS